MNATSSEEVIVEESEHEEGEISSEDDDISEDGEISCLSPPYSSSVHPHHHSHSYSVRRTASVTSEVVIYDDNGRTAIFTSPKKNKNLVRGSGNYRVSEGKWSRDEVGIRRERDEASSRRERDEASSRRERDEVSSRRERDEANSRRERNDANGRRERDEITCRRDREEASNRRRVDVGGSSSKPKEEDIGRRRWHDTQLDSKSKGKSGTIRQAIEKGSVNESGAAADHKNRGSCYPQCSSRKRDSSSGTSSETTSCSCSSTSEDDCGSPKTLRGEGKENKSYGAVAKNQDEPRPQQEYGPVRPPPKSTIVRPPLHHKTTSKHKSIKISLSASKETLKKYPWKKNPQKSIQKSPQNTKLQNTKSSLDTKCKSKTGQLSLETVADLTLVKGLKQPPPGSLGEMLLKKRIKNQLKVLSKSSSVSDPSAGKNAEGVTASVSGKQKVGELTHDMAAECGTRDQEDEDELQLRLLALQSSLRYLSDIRKEGALGLSSSGRTTPTNWNEGNKIHFEVENCQLQHLEKNSPLLEVENSYLIRAKESSPVRSNDSSPIIVGCLLQENMPTQMTMGFTEEKDIILKENGGVIVEDFHDNSIQCISLTSSPEHELGTGGFSMSIVQPGVGKRLKQGRTKSEEFNGSTRDHQDSNQDPVDMDICDSSGEEEGDAKEEDLIQEVGEDHVLDTRDSSVNATPVTFTPTDFQSGSGEGSSGIAETVQNNFQIPVEWAYMMPPPPPPDQPANDIDNFTNWCYDQNMYLQTMQVPYETNNQCCQYGVEGMNSEEWGKQQQEQQIAQTSEWCSQSKDTHEHTPDSSLLHPPYPTLHEKGENGQFESTQMENNDANDVYQQVPEPKEDLKDLPAEKYQAFMSAVLNQQSPPKKSSVGDRTLIQVPIIKYGNVPASVLSKRGEARRRKRERQKHRLKVIQDVTEHTMTTSVGICNILDGSKPFDSDSRLVQADIEPRPLVASVCSKEMQPPVDSRSVPAFHSGTEEEDEDLLRAQLLIDMSNRKRQKVAVPSKLAKSLHVPLAVNSSTALSKNLGHRFSPILGEGTENSTVSCVFPSLSELSSTTLTHVPLTAPQKNLHTVKSRTEEGSPSRVLKMDGRANLSDIGGFGLDPKSSQFYYQGSRDSSSVIEGQKIQFPKVKPVVINLNSDSEDDEQPWSQEDSSDTQKEAEPEASSSGAFIHSLDMLLKRMRNAKPTSPIGRKFEAPRQGSSEVNTESSQSDSTPQAVRHLSRHQQVEYRRLKELLRKKEILQHKKMQQKRSCITTAFDNRLQIVSPSHRVTTAGEGTSGMDVTSATTTSNTMECHGRGKVPSGRAVSWREMGRLKIKLSNIASTLDKQSAATASKKMRMRVGMAQQPDVIEDTPTPVGGSPRDTSATEEEDEEALRMMVLHTLKKNKSEKAYNFKNRKVMVETGSEEDEMSSTTKVGDPVEAGTPLASLKVVIHQKTDNVQDASRDNKDKDPQQGDDTRVVVLSERAKVEEDENEQNANQIELDETLAGEWMVLDQVLDEDSEGSVVEEGAEENSSKSGLSEVEKKFSGSDTSDSEALKPSESEALDKVPSIVKNNNKESSKENGGGCLGTRVECTNINADTSVHNHTNVRNEQVRDVCVDKLSLENIHEIKRKKCVRMLNQCVESQESPENKGRIEGVNIGMKNSPCSIKESSTMQCVKESDSLVSSAQHSQNIVQTGFQCISSDTQEGKMESKVKETFSKVTTVQGKSMKDSIYPLPVEVPHSLDERLQTTTESLDCKHLTSQESEATIVNEGEEQKQKVDKNSTNCQDVSGRCKGKSIKNASSSVNKKSNISKISDACKPTQVGDIKLEKSDKQDKITQLKSVEVKYTDKRHGMNRVISQLDVLVKEATLEEQQRQTLRKTVTQLRTHLADIENQLETKADEIKIKMEKIRSLHSHILTDRKLIGELQKQGELLGRQVFGSGYSMPKVSMSPHSKTRDTHVKKALASSIDALHRMREGSSGANSTLAPANTIGNKVVRSLKTDINIEREKSQQQVLVKSPVLGGKVTQNASSLQTLTRNVFQTKLAKGSQTVTKDTSFLQTKGKVGATSTASATKVTKRKVPPSDTQAVVKIAKTMDTTQSITQNNNQAQGSGQTSSASNEDKRLDEMSVLCPHDLLGRCNDDACIYQHIAQPIFKSHPTTQTRVVQVSRGSTSDSRVALRAGKTELGTRTRNTTKGRAARVEKTSFEAGVGVSGLDSKMGQSTLVKSKVKPKVKKEVSNSKVGSGTSKMKVATAGLIGKSHEVKKSHAVCQKNSPLTSETESRNSLKSDKEESVFNHSTVNVQNQPKPVGVAETDDCTNPTHQRIDLVDGHNKRENEHYEKVDVDRNQDVSDIKTQTLNNSLGNGDGDGETSVVTGQFEVLCADDEATSQQDVHMTNAEIGCISDTDKVHIEYSKLQEVPQLAPTVHIVSGNASYKELSREDSSESTKNRQEQTAHEGPSDETLKDVAGKTEDEFHGNEKEHNERTTDSEVVEKESFVNAVCSKRSRKCNVPTPIADESSVKKRRTAAKRNLNVESNTEAKQGKKKNARRIVSKKVNDQDCGGKTAEATTPARVQRPRRRGRRKK